MGAAIYFDKFYSGEQVHRHYNTPEEAVEQAVHDVVLGYDVTEVIDDSGVVVATRRDLDEIVVARKAAF
jgi:hypothetical protein